MSGDGRPWYEERPQRLQRELQDLEQRGIRYRMREDLQETEQRIVLELNWPTGDGDLDLRACYPDAFPYFRPEVATDSVTLPRHQNPFEGVICLIGRSTIEWDPERTLAEHIADQLPEVLDRGDITDPKTLREVPGEQAEPVTDYYPYPLGAAILVDPPSELGALTDRPSGRLLIGFPSPFVTDPVRGAVLEIRTEDRECLHAIDAELAALYPERIGGSWVRLSEAPPPDLKALVEAIRRVVPHAIRSGHAWPPVENAWVDIVGVTFPVEVSPGEFADGWPFFVQTAARRRGSRGEAVGYLARGIRVGREQHFARAPELQPLAEKTIAIVGLGCLGAPSAVEFARAGVRELRIVDHDFADAGPSVRWPFGIRAAGKAKAHAITQFIEKHYPYATVRPITRKLGALRGRDETPEWEALDELLHGCSLVYDASAEWGVQHYLSQAARERGIPYVMVAGRQGAWGGVILRDMPGDDGGCWSCYRHHVNDETIMEPPESRAGSVQPVGCAEPTFTGTNFDLGQIALGGVRLAVATLCREDAAGYPDFDWDVAVVAFRDEDGGCIAPAWATFSLERHPHCKACG